MGVTSSRKFSTFVRVVICLKWIDSVKNKFGSKCLHSFCYFQFTQFSLFSRKIGFIDITTWQFTRINFMLCKTDFRIFEATCKWLRLQIQQKWQKPCKTITINACKVLNYKSELFHWKWKNYWCHCKVDPNFCPSLMIFLREHLIFQGYNQLIKLVSYSL